MSDDEDTITLSDGTVIDMQTGKPRSAAPEPAPGFIAVPSNTEAVREVTRVRRRLSELPDAPERMNPIAVVVAYYMFGLEDWEIAHAVGCTEKQIANIKMTAPFDEMLKMMQQNLIDGQSNDTRALIARGGSMGVNVMLEALQSPSETTRVVAAKDMMDRAGFRPADVVEHRHRVEGGLTIEYVSKSKDDEMPVIDINPERLQ